MHTQDRRVGCTTQRVPEHTQTTSSVFATLPSHQVSTLHLDFTAIPGRLYGIEESPDLNGTLQDTATLGPVGSPGTQRMSFTPPPGSPRWFVRLRLATIQRREILSAANLLLRSGLVFVMIFILVATQY